MKRSILLLISALTVSIASHAYVVTLSRNGEIETVNATDTYTLPTAGEEADACDGWLFRGWIESGASFAEGQTYAPDFVTTVSSASTLEAVYGQNEGEGEMQFVKATSVDAGDQVVLVYAAGRQELSGFSTSGTIYGLSESYTEAPNGKYLLEVVPGTSAETFGLKHEELYLSWTSNNSLTTSTSLNTNSSWTITFNDVTTKSKW